MKNNIKKAPVNVRVDLLYFQHFMLILFLPQISDYHHLNLCYGFTGCRNRVSYKSLLSLMDFITAYEFVSRSAEAV